MLPCALAMAATLLTSTAAMAGGFEVGDNTTKSVARGGTGVALKADPSALYFNPALLPRARGFQLLLNSNFVALDVEFDRDPLVYGEGANRVERRFDTATNDAGPFPAPFLTASWDMGIENFAIALGAFGPSAYGRLCYGQITEDNTCELNSYPEPSEGVIQDPNAARHMMLESQLLQIYFTLGAGYTFKLKGDSELSIGVAGALAYQRNSFKIMLDAELPPKAPWEENPEDEATFEAKDLTDLRPTGFFGLAYRNGGFHFGASYRPPIRWKGEGTATLDLPQDLQDVSGARLTDDAVTLELTQAGTLRVGVGWTQGQHPRFENRPRLELEGNVVWEDWSRTQTFDVTLQGELELSLTESSIELAQIKQDKSWQDTYSLRLGGAYAVNKWVTASLGGFMETPTQSNAYTNADFIAWERYGAGLGATIHATDWLDIDLGYMYIGMPERTVSNGDVYNAVPLSSCQEPYDGDACQEKGTPPGNPQNEGTWNARYQTSSVGFTLHFD
jgi:long-subunit fatty acid transport protein